MLITDICVLIEMFWMAFFDFVLISLLSLKLQFNRLHSREYQSADLWGLWGGVNAPRATPWLRAWRPTHLKMLCHLWSTYKEYHDGNGFTYQYLRLRNPPSPELAFIFTTGESFKPAIFQTTSLRVLDLRKLEINLISFTKPTVFPTVEGYGKPNFPNSPTYRVK